MIVCCDTSFLCSLYGNDAHSIDAVAICRRLTSPLILSAFNEFEFENAMRLAGWRGLLNSQELSGRLALFSTDLTAGRLQMAPCDHADVMAIAKRLSATHTSGSGYRGFDILHVAAALHLGADVFITFDAKQAALATAENMRTTI